MLKLKQGVDILAEVGGVKSIDEAQQIFKDKLDSENLAKLEKIKTEEALIKIANAIKFCKPDKVMVTTGSPEDMMMVRKMSIEKGEESHLAMKDHTIHFDLPEEQGRIVDRTFYIINEGEPVSSLGKKILRDEGHAYVKENMDGIMQGKTMMVGFFSRGPAGAKLSLPAIEISSSTYVMHSGDMLYRHVYDTFDEQVSKSGLFLTNVHSEGPNRPEDLPKARVFMDRSWLTTFSMYCTYAGNTLLLKKGNHRFAVDLATYYGEGKELSEHMFITGMQDKSGKVTWFAGAAPSGCGKTTTAMAGTEFIGDDLAQMWVADDGTLRAINPERGIFGIVADVNYQGDPYLMKALREEGAEVIWSNVLIDDKKVPHWTGNGEEHPDKGFNFQGEWFKGKKNESGKEIPISHPNARCTLRNESIGNFSTGFGHDPTGVAIKVITYSGRDADTMPPVWVGKNPDHGVVIGASIVSAATATEVGATGVKRQPWANAPFIPGSLSDYMKNQFDVYNHAKLTEEGSPILAGLNYFLTDASRGGSTTKLLGEKRDVKVWLTWLSKFAHGDVEGIETPIGFIPKYDDLKELFSSIINKAYSKELYDKHFSIYVDKIQSRIELQKEAFGKEENLPKQLFIVYDEWSEGLKELKDKFGAIVTPDKLM
ncbi:MAG: phosphoenolpyruvate carboxykinase (GTP) [Ignavibacteriaceae bacterium]|nr:phosphoenolpyruvate carboxykinase (GTP) [Ignavibacteria bacterium]NNJ52291.1 phosphoenolpyruvate carboxykinase (GTP) [Ignavibacteriaceae bacterium]NNL20383.1 phosphoenolpyruvate carboxykinase (GTP) [Ignavibacteriaceae bacterium]